MKMEFTEILSAVGNTGTLCVMARFICLGLLPRQDKKPTHA